MEYRKVKGTDLEFSAITFGTIWFTNSRTRPHIDPEVGKRALHAALDSGVNVIHSSFEYLTRPMVRTVLKERGNRDQLYHVIKVPSPDSNARALKHDNFMPAYFRVCVEEALLQMDLERVDLLQWIQRDDTTGDPARSIPKFHALRDDLVATFEKMRDEGKVGYLSTFVYEPEFAKEAAKADCIQGFMFYYNLFDTTLFPCFEALRESGKSALAFRPFHGGLLTQKRADPDALPPGDKMANERGMDKMLRRDKLLAEAGIETDDLTKLAIKFPLASQEIASLVVSINTPEQVKQVCAAADGDYPPADLPRRVFNAAQTLGGPWNDM